MAKLNLNDLTQSELWANAETALPQYDVSAMRKETIENPTWVHFGGGNLFRAYIAALGQKLLDENLYDKGIIVASGMPDATKKYVYDPYDNLSIQVFMHADGRYESAVIASIAESIDIQQDGDMARFVEIFENPSLQMVTFTITEKGYNIEDMHGNLQPQVAEDIEKGPVLPKNTMAFLAALLYKRFSAGAFPIGLASFDNFSHNGQKLKKSITTVAAGWIERGLVDVTFLDYLNDSTKVGFPNSTIDKITPGPSEKVAQLLQERGLEDAKIFYPERGAPQATFVNAEVAQYLVVEDAFPNGRPPLDKAGVYFTDRDTVDAFERMKVCTCLNPLHTALAVYGCILGYDSIAAEMQDEDLVKMVNRLAYDEGMKVVSNPGIVDPEAFVAEVIKERLPNANIPDTPQRIAADTSQKIPIRFGETIASYRASDTLSTEDLHMIPLAIAGWIRYALQIDDEGKPFENSPDPLLEEVYKVLADVQFGKPQPLKGILKPLLQNKVIFKVDLTEDALGDRITALVEEMIEGPGAVRKVLHREVNA